MSEWISIKNSLPLNDSFVRVKILCLFPAETNCLFIDKHFVNESSEDLTSWVTHWMPLPDEPK